MFLIAGLGGLTATIAVGPAARSVVPQQYVAPSPAPRPFVTLEPRFPGSTLPPVLGGQGPNLAVLLLVSFPFVGPGLLLVASGLSYYAAARESRGGIEIQPTVMARIGELASSRPVGLLSGPRNSAASAYGEVPTGIQFDVLEEVGEYVHVRGSGFEGYLPARLVRLV
jgi:hypothetical protein